MTDQGILGAVTITRRWLAILGAFVFTMAATICARQIPSAARVLSVSHSMTATVEGARVYISRSLAGVRHEEALGQLQLTV